MAKKKKLKYDVTKHDRVPKHSKLSQKDLKTLCEKLKITVKNLPKISLKDPAIKSLGASEGDVIKIERSSPTSGNTVYYRGVINE